VIQSKHACPLAQKHTPNPKRLLSTQSKRQEVPPRDELPPDPKDELFLSASWSTTDAQHKNPFKGSLKQTCKSLNFVATLGKRKTFSNKPFFSQIARPTTQIQNHPMIIIKSDFHRAYSGREKKQEGKQTNKQTNRDSCNSHNFCKPFASAQKEETTQKALLHKLGMTFLLLLDPMFE
jgi:hypothetical protein